ncbi:hypothetical protein ACSMXN_09340 [Jatrophihabitans sp. DSM 45814]
MLLLAKINEPRVSPGQCVLLAQVIPVFLLAGVLERRNVRRYTKTLTSRLAWTLSVFCGVVAWVLLIMGSESGIKKGWPSWTIVISVALVLAPLVLGPLQIVFPDDDDSSDRKIAIAPVSDSDTPSDSLAARTARALRSATANQVHRRH